MGTGCELTVAKKRNDEKIILDITKLCICRVGL